LKLYFCFSLRGEALQDPNICWQGSLGKLLSKLRLLYMPWGCPKVFSLPLAPLINITSNADNLKEKFLECRLSLLGRNNTLKWKGSPGMHSVGSRSS